MSKDPILKGIRVLDLTRVMSGPFCTSMLADLGAEVIKIELPVHGDEARSFGPYKDGESTYFMLLNRNKKSVTVDLKSPDGQGLIKALLPKCDVIVENYRPGVMERLGLDEATIREHNPSIIYARISGFGQDGPLRNLPAFDLVIQAMSGMMSLTGPKGGPQTAVGESIADVSTGMFSAFGIVAALFDRARTGTARQLDIAMLDSMMAMQLTGLSRQLYSGDTPAPIGNRHPVTYPVDSFPTRTGDIVMVCFSQDGFIELCKLMGKPELATNRKFATNSDRNANEDELRGLISEWTRSLTQDAAVNTLIEARIPAAPIWNLQQLCQSDHVRSRAMVVDGEHADFGRVPLVPQPVQFSGVENPRRPVTPGLGQHTEEVLGSLAGLDANAIAKLREAKVI